jgi:hypothetical protein
VLACAHRSVPQVPIFIKQGGLYGGHTVDAELGVSDNLLDLTIGLKVGKRLSCKRAVDLQTIDEGGNSDETVGLDILLELVVGLLVENDGVLGLVLDCEIVSGDSSLWNPKCARESYEGMNASEGDFERVWIFSMCVEKC